MLSLVGGNPNYIIIRMAMIDSIDSNYSRLYDKKIVKVYYHPQYKNMSNMKI